MPAPPKPRVPAAEAAAQFAGADTTPLKADGLDARSRDTPQAPTGAGASADGMGDADRRLVADARVADAPTAVSPPRKPRVPRKTKKKARESAPVVDPGAVLPEPVAGAEPQPVVDAEPQPEQVVEAQPEQVVEADPEQVVEAEPGVEPEPVVEAEPEPVVEAEPGEPEPVVEAEPVVEPEPVVEAEPEPEPVAEPEPAVVREPVAAEHAQDRTPLALDREIVVDLAEDAERHVDATDAPDALRLRGVSKSFGETRAVDAIDLTVEPGTFYGIVGPNGAGKTTTLSMATGLLRPDHGTIEVAGIDLATNPARAKRMMGVLPDRLRTFDRLTGRQLLYYYGVLRGLRPAVVESRVADLARAFDLTDALGRTVADYSAGMTKKVMLAGAMIHSPRVLVLDEPFESVDPVSSAVILDILKAYVAHGGTVVLSSHGMDLVEKVCSAVAVIVAGQVLAEGTVDEVRGELTLEQRFIELAGGLSDVEGLEWLHTFSG